MEQEKRNRWEVVLELAGPMQIGAGTLGMVEQTEVYVPGRVVWGGLTNALVNEYGDGKPETYERVGNALGIYGEHCGTLFPSTDAGKSVWRPRYSPNNNHREWINSSDENKVLSESELRGKLVFTLTSTAYNPLQKEANETLHATDLVMHRVMEKEEKVIAPVCMKGCLDIPEKMKFGNEYIQLDASVLEECFTKMRLGGGRKRGWGRIRPKEINEINADGIALKEASYNGYRWLLSPDYQVQAGTKAYGRTNLAVYRVYKSGARHNGFGQGFSRPGYCWDVGTLLVTT